MMYRLFCLSVLFAVFAQAQTAPQGPTKLDVSITTNNNTSVIPVDLTIEEGRTAPHSSITIVEDTEKLNSTENSSSFSVMKEVSQEPPPETSLGTTLADKFETSEMSDEKTTFFMEIAQKYKDEGDFAEAEQAYLRVLKKNPDNPSIRFALSALYNQTARHKEEEAILLQMKEDFPNHPILYNNLAWLYATAETMKNSSKALLYAREALLSRPTDPALWDTLAEAYYIGGDYEKALRSSNHSIDLLQQLGAKQEQLQPYIDRRIKIQRADEAFKRLTGEAEKTE